MFNKSQKSFTLLELLIVVAIIILLTSLVLVFIWSAGAKARDTKRKAEVETLSQVLAFYYTDYGTYPTTTGWVKLEEDTDLQAKLKPYLPEIPKDPRWPNSKDADRPYSYQYYSTSTDGATGYKIHVELETEDYYEIFGGSGGESIIYIGFTEQTRWASIKLYTYGNDPKWLTIKHLDGSADDDFNLFINGVKIWDYTDQTTTETWYVDHISLDVTGETELTIKLEATGEKWSQWNTYGQIGISHYWLRLDDGSTVGEVDSGDTIIDEVDIGDPTSEGGHNLVGWGPIEPDTSGGNWGGIAGDPDDQTCRVIWSPTE